MEQIQVSLNPATMAKTNVKWGGLPGPPGVLARGVLYSVPTFHLFLNGLISMIVTRGFCVLLQSRVSVRVNIGERNNGQSLESTEEIRSMFSCQCSAFLSIKLSPSAVILPSQFATTISTSYARSMITSRSPFSRSMIAGLPLLRLNSSPSEEDAAQKSQLTNS